MYVGVGFCFCFFQRPSHGLSARKAGEVLAGNWQVRGMYGISRQVRPRGRQVQFLNQ
jgi:hypothetical protein